MAVALVSGCALRAAQEHLSGLMPPLCPHCAVGEVSEEMPPHLTIKRPQRRRVRLAAFHLNDCFSVQDNAAHRLIESLNHRTIGVVHPAGNP
jgi:hypothetical protein